MDECPGVVDTHWGSVMSETGVDTREACDSLWTIQTLHNAWLSNTSRAGRLFRGHWIIHMLSDLQFSRFLMKHQIFGQLT